MTLDIREVYKQKGLTDQEIEFVRKLSEGKGELSNKDLANLWGKKTLPYKTKNKLLEDPPFLVLVEASPQKYVYYTQSDKKAVEPKKETKAKEAKPKPEEKISALESLVKDLNEEIRMREEIITEIEEEREQIDIEMQNAQRQRFDDVKKVEDENKLLIVEIQEMKRRLDNPVFEQEVLKLKKELSKRDAMLESLRERIDSLMNSEGSENPNVRIKNLERENRELKASIEAVKKTEKEMRDKYYKMQADADFDKNFGI